MRARIVKITDQRLQAVRNGLEVSTSLEGENAGGSIKDWMVLGELESLMKSGELKRGDAIAEISAGSTARSLAYHSREFGLKCVLFVPDTLSPEKKASLEALGAEIHSVDVKTAFDDYAKFISEKKIRTFDQFGNKSLGRHYANLAKEVSESVDAVIGTIGTGHSLLGTGRALPGRPVIVSAEPESIGAVSGIRNVSLENFGKNDPCATAKFIRVIVANRLFFPANEIETDAGKVEISETFRVLLGALQIWGDACSNRRIFAVGAANKRIA